MRDILRGVRDGEISIDEAERQLRLTALEEIEDASLDIQREARAGLPEVVYGEGKTAGQVIEIISALLERDHPAIVTRASDTLADSVQQALDDRYVIEFNRRARIIVGRKSGTEPVSTGRKIGIMTAGTTDIVVAEEARTIAEEMGCHVLTAYDIGIAGFHRHIEPLKHMLAESVDVIVVVVGMEGALPSVIASLANVPVIGVPTSTGYGLGGKGIGALTTMLQSCSMGLSVVNIDNGVGAGAFAALIARRVASILQDGGSK